METFSVMFLRIDCALCIKCTLCLENKSYSFISAFNVEILYLRRCLCGLFFTPVHLCKCHAIKS